LFSIEISKSNNLPGWLGYHWMISWVSYQSLNTKNNNDLKPPKKEIILILVLVFKKLYDGCITYHVNWANYQLGIWKHTLMCNGWEFSGS